MFWRTDRTQPGSPSDDSSPRSRFSRSGADAAGRKGSSGVRRSELEAIFGGVTDLIRVIDTDTYELLYLNDANRKKARELLGEKCYFALQGRGSPCPHCSVSRLLASDSEIVVVREGFDEGHRLWQRNIDRLIEWPDGRRVLLEVVTDITDQKRAELALKESEGKYRQLLANAQEGIAVLQDGVLCFFNPRFPEIVGRPPDELRSMPFVEMVDPADRSLVSRTYEKRIRGEVVPSDYEFRVLTGSGQTRWLEINAVLIGWEGRPATLNFVTDVTERRAAVDVLRSRETLFRSTIESIGDGILVVDREGNVTHANERYAAMWNVTPEMLAQRDVRLLREHGAAQIVDPKPFLERTEALYSSDEESFDTIEFRDGRSMERYSSPLVQDGGVTGRVWCFRDVTESRAAERARRESEERLRLMFETVKDAMFVIKDGVFVDCNSRALEMFRAERSQIVGHPPGVLSPPTQEGGRDSVELAASLMEECLGGRPQFAEWVHRRFDGVDFASEVTLDGFELVGEKYVQAIVHDVTERKHAEEVRDVLFQISQAVNEARGLDELLATIHRQLGRLINTTNYYVALYDETTDTYTFPYHIDEEDELEELTPIQLKKSLTDYVRRTGKPVLVDEELHLELEHAGEVELVGAPSPIWLGVPLKVEQRVIGVVVVQSYVEGSLYTQRDLDIMTFVSDNIAVAIERVRSKEQREQLEAQIQHAQKLESLGVLAGGIAHDFNNLLTGILGNADLALLDVHPDSPACGSLREIRATAQRAADLSRQMLAYSGKGSFVIEPIDLNEVVREMASLLEVSISKRAEMSYELSDSIPMVVGDATQLRQVIMNLITNASDAVGEADGTITIASEVKYCDDSYLAECYLVQDVPAGSFVSLSISDTGCGMDAETVQKIFDPFFTTKFTGRGLGLASTLGIVRGHGGAVRVSSEPGVGTTFEILLPAGDEKLPTTERPRQEAGTVAGVGTVMVVDDEETVREVAARMLEQSGLSVVKASDGLEAVAYFKDHASEVGCVLLDLTMPRMSGEETLEALREIRADVKVVFSSGYSEQEVVGRLDDESVVGFVQKPYLISKLVSTIGDALAQ